MTAEHSEKQVFYKESKNIAVQYESFRTSATDGEQHQQSPGAKSFQVSIKDSSQAIFISLRLLAVLSDCLQPQASLSSNRLTSRQVTNWALTQLRITWSILEPWIEKELCSIRTLGTLVTHFFETFLLFCRSIARDSQKSPSSLTAASLWTSCLSTALGFHSLQSDDAVQEHFCNTLHDTVRLSSQNVAFAEAAKDQFCLQDREYSSAENDLLCVATKVGRQLATFRELR